VPNLIDMGILCAYQPSCVIIPNTSISVFHWWLLPKHLWHIPHQITQNFCNF